MQSGVRVSFSPIMPLFFFHKPLDFAAKKSIAVVGPRTAPPPRSTAIMRRDCRSATTKEVSMARKTSVKIARNPAKKTAKKKPSDSKTKTGAERLKRLGDILPDWDEQRALLGF